MVKLLNVVGARPNFVKIAPLIEAMHDLNFVRGQTFFQPVLVHTGQHYDHNMSDVFFKDLEIPKPDIYLGVGSGSHSEQVSKIILAFEKVCLDEKPDLVLVVGDVNATLACGLVASKIGIPIAHVEAGLRSFDRSMPEEINRVVTDALSDYLFVSERSGIDNLRKENKNEDQIYFVGNVMIDTLFKYLKKSSQSSILKQLGVLPKTYGVVTLHRPSNVDRLEILEPILKILVELSSRMPLLLPIHPRTRQQIEKWGLQHYFSDLNVVDVGVYLLDPLGYLDFICLVNNAKLVLTDSGGIQEETTALGVPCLTLRENTERPITLIDGTNSLVGVDPARILRAGNKIIDGEEPKGILPELWDGKAAHRIIDNLYEVAPF